MTPTIFHSWRCLRVQEDRPAKKAKVFSGRGARLTDFLPPPENAEPASAVLGLGAGQVLMCWPGSASAALYMWLVDLVLLQCST